MQASLSQQILSSKYKRCVYTYGLAWLSLVWFSYCRFIQASDVKSERNKKRNEQSATVWSRTASIFNENITEIQKKTNKCIMVTLNAVYRICHWHLRQFKYFLQHLWISKLTTKFNMRERKITFIKECYAGLSFSFFFIDW